MYLKNTDRIGISIILCCYNSKDRIGPTLEHLAKQKGISFPWEVLLIDNNCKDNTPDIAIDTWQLSGRPCKLSIIKEPRAGTMYARHRGIIDSRFRYLLFCDDDNWLNPNYVKTAFDIIVSDPAIAAVGGIGILEFEPDFSVPHWSQKFKKTFGAGPQGRVDGDTTYDKGCLYTAGAILDRVWLDRLYTFGFKSSLKGRDGKSLVAGEDTELTYALKLIGGKLYYCSEMHFKHFMPKARVTWSYLKKMWEAFGFSDFLISPYKITFKQRKYKPWGVTILHQLFWVAKFFLFSALCFFSVGSENVLKFHRALGQLKASVFNYSTFLRNRKMVNTLSFKTNTESEKI